jgi:hypothetical protein
LQDFLYRKQDREYYHHAINQQLGLIPVLKMPVSPQISGNCSWANIQAVVPVAYAMQQLTDIDAFSPDEAMDMYDAWVEWDQDRALDECIQCFYQANRIRKASLASMLAAVLFQTCDHENPHHIERSAKILAILSIPEYFYILQSYLDVYCVKRLTRRGNNLLKLLDDCGVNSNINVTPIATGLDNQE